MYLKLESSASRVGSSGRAVAASIDYSVQAGMLQNWGNAHAVQLALGANGQDGAIQMLWRTGPADGMTVAGGVHR